MDSKFNFFVDNTVLYRSLFYASILTIPILNFWFDSFNSMFVLIAIFLGVGYYSKPRWFHLLFTFILVELRTISTGELDSNLTFVIRLIVYFTVTFLAVEFTKQFHIQKNNKTELIMTISKLLDSRDSYTANHSENVAKYSMMIANELGLSKTSCRALYIGGLLHDTGKIGVPEMILTKPTKLNNEEYEIIKQHPSIGYESLKHLSLIQNLGVLDMIHYHHERYDGNGYPKGLKGNEIPVSARIMAIADSFDAMTSKRVYNDANTIEFAIHEIEKNKGSQFDPQIADAFMNLLKRGGIELERKEQADTNEESVI